MTAEFNKKNYCKIISELSSYSSLAPFGEPEILGEGYELRKEAAAELKNKYPTASDGAISYLIDYELNEFASNLLHPEYEKEALKLLAS